MEVLNLAKGLVVPLLFSLLIGFAVVGVLKLSRDFEVHETNTIRRLFLVEESASINRKIATNNRSFNKITSAQVDILAASANIDKYKKARIDHLRKVIREEIKSLPISLSAHQRSKMAINLSKFSDIYDIPLALMTGLLRQESAFNPKAVSWMEAKGLGQIMDATGDDIKEWLGPKFPGPFKPFRIDHNIHFSAFYLSRMLDTFDYNRESALMAYNAGPKKILRLVAREKCMLKFANEQQAPGVPEHYCGPEVKLEKETVDYVLRVLQYTKKYEELGVH